MRPLRTLRLVGLGAITLLLLILIIGCERPFQTITYENHTQSTIQVKAALVQRGWDGKATFEWMSSVLPVEPGQSQTFATGVSPTRRAAKYLIEAIDQNNVLVFSKVLTWDELHDSGWKVVITPTIEGVESGDNTTIDQAQ